MTEFEQLVNISFLIGNDLETSEVLYFTSTCIKSKERLLLCKDSLFISHKQIEYIRKSIRLLW